MSVINHKHQKTNNMKTLILTLVLATVSISSFANAGGEERKEVKEQAKDLIMNEQLFDSMDYSGELSVSFTIDEEDRIQINSIETDDYSLEYHVRQSLQNVKVVASESMVGKTIGFVIDLVSAK